MKGRAAEAADEPILDGERTVAGDVVAAEVVRSIIDRGQRRRVDVDGVVGGRDHERVVAAAAGSARPAAAAVTALRIAASEDQTARH